MELLFSISIINRDIIRMKSTPKLKDGPTFQQLNKPIHQANKLTENRLRNRTLKTVSCTWSIKTARKRGTWFEVL